MFLIETGTGSMASRVFFRTMLRRRAFRFLIAGAVLAAAACSHPAARESAPSPDPALIREIRLTPQDSSACPGSVIRTTYQATLADGSTVPIVRLERTSPDATPLSDGNWRAQRDPLATVSTGFRLTAALPGKPEVTRTLVLKPRYDCLPHSFSFSGSWGAGSFSGGDGPDVTVRVSVIHSPFFERLYLARVEVNGRSPSSVLADPATLAPSDWLTVTSQGGDGGSGSAGSDGIDGTPGGAGCPGSDGGNGSNGSDGGAGGDGGNGGRITVVVPRDQPQLADLVRAYSAGGSGGSGGAGGHGGRGGSGGTGTFDMNNQPCANGRDGFSGLDGSQGRSGFSGSGRGRAVVVAQQ